MVSGSSSGIEYPISSEIIIGRQSDNQIPIDDSKSSRKNSRIFSDNGIYYVEDLKSRNGTFVNGKTISTHKLCHGDKIQIGETIILFIENDSNLPEKSDEIVTKSESLKKQVQSIETNETVKSRKKETKPAQNMLTLEEILANADKQNSGAEKKQNIEKIADKQDSSENQSVEKKQSVEKISVVPKKKNIVKSSNKKAISKSPAISLLSLDFSECSFSYKAIFSTFIIFFMFCIVLVARWLTLQILN